MQEGVKKCFVFKVISRISRQQADCSGNKSLKM
jgi:hypothetical protein